MKGYLHERFFHKSVHSVDGSVSGVVCDVDEEGYRVRIKLAEGSEVSDWVDPFILVPSQGYYWEHIYKFA